jgi:hypothetical protein
MFMFQEKKIQMKSCHYSVCVDVDRRFFSSSSLHARETKTLAIFPTTLMYPDRQEATSTSLPSPLDRFVSLTDRKSMVMIT